MNQLTIIGNLTKDPELRVTPSGVSVCSFTVAVNRRKTPNNQDPGADFFRVAAWRELGENCNKWLIKGRKVCVVGPVTVRTYQGADGKTYANMDVTAEKVEFLSSPGEAPKEEAPKEAPKIDKQSGMEQVEDDELPF